MKNSLLTLMMLLSVFSFSQKLSLKGSVQDESGLALPGANVFIIGTTLGAITDADGKFTLQVEKENAKKISFSSVGYKTVVLEIGEKLEFNVKLAEDAVGLDEVIVTALGITREKKALSYSAQDMKAKELDKARDPNVANLLSGKVAGLQVNTANTIGGSSRIVIRGETSLSAKGSAPLVVVDGIPIDNSDNSGSLDYGSGISEVNAADIESMSVLKGAAAAALYGSRAGNGVIVITTKSGKGSKRFEISYTGSLMFEEILKYPDTYQYEYVPGNGTSSLLYKSDGTYNPGVYDETWGNEKYDPNRLVETWYAPTKNGYRAGDTGIANKGDVIKVPYVSNGTNNFEEFYETGFTKTNNFSLKFSGEKSHLRLSYTRMNQEGVMPGTDLNRNNLSVNFGASLTDKLKVSSVINFVKTDSKNRPINQWGRTSVAYHLAWMAPGMQMDVLKDYWQKGLEGKESIKWRGSHNNPYFVSNELRYPQEKYRGFGNIKLNYTILEGLNLMLRYGGDLSQENRESIIPFGGVPASVLTPNYSLNSFVSREMNADFLLSYEMNLQKDLKLGLSFGGNNMQSYYKGISGGTNELLVPGIYTVGNSKSNVSAGSSLYQKEMNSLYGTADFSYKDAYYLNLTGRNDWSSTLPDGNNSYFYPSLGLSILPNQIIDLPKFISFSKLRFAAAQVGKDVGPYQLTSTLGHSSPYNGHQFYYTPGNIPNADLKPEEVTSFEYGFDLRFFENRLGFDFTYYNSKTENQVINANLPISSTYSSKKINAGEIANRGIELTLTAVPLKTSNFEWKSIFNFSKNENELVALHGDIEKYSIAGAGGVNVIAKVGEPLMCLYGNKQLTVTDKASPFYGQKIYSKDGQPVKNPEVEYLGNANPDWILGITNSFSYKDFSFSFMFDIRHGGKVYSGITKLLTSGGYNTMTADWRNDGVIGEGVRQLDDGSFVKNDVEFKGPDAKSYIKTYTKIADNFIYDASFIKLRNINLTYSIPKSVLTPFNISAASVSLTGRNLLLFSDVPNQDPDTYSSGVPGYTGSYFLPNTKTYGFSVNVKF